MRRTMTALACLALVAGGWNSVRAQEAEYAAPEYSGPMYHQIVDFTVSPADAATFETTIEKIVEAAKLANLSKDYGWWFFRDGANFTLVYPVASMGYFDDEEQWMRQFQGTPGEAALGEAMAGFAGLNYSSKSQIMKLKPEHSYRPKAPIENPNYNMVYMNWVKPGQQEAHAENTKALMKIISDVEWRYEVMAFESVIGDGGLRAYVVPFDDLSTYHGEGSLSAYLAAHEKAEEWKTLQEARMKLVRAMDSMEMEFIPGMTYWPEPEAGGGE